MNHPCCRRTRTPEVMMTIAVAVTLAAGVSSAAADDSEEADPAAPEQVESYIVDQTLLVTAGSQESMSIAATPGTGGGPTIICGWFGLLFGGPEVINVGQVLRPVIGDTYLLWCWYAHDLENLSGHPLVATYTGPGVPGEPADEKDVSDFALASMDFVDPALVVNPGATHIVGIDSWLAVSSQLDYHTVHANAGPVWVSVRPRFRNVVWDLGNGDTVSCTRDRDATTVWEPDVSDQSSECTYTYENSGDGEYDVSATVTWTIMRRTFRQDAWLPWRDFSLTTTHTMQVAELQAAID